jgi:hypothetical protein
VQVLYILLSLLITGRVQFRSWKGPFADAVGQCKAKTVGGAPLPANSLTLNRAVKHCGGSISPALARSSKEMVSCLSSNVEILENHSQTTSPCSYLDGKD